jgi:hypothetical protein
MPQPTKMHTSTARVFDFVEQNLPGQAADDDIRTMNNLEFILWMIGISGGIILLQFLFHLLF